MRGTTSMINFCRMAWMLALVGLVSVFTGCTPTYTDYSAFIQEPRPKSTSVEYRLAPPDSVKVMSKRVREINGTVQPLRPDGMITLSLIGEVYAAGLTPRELARVLEEKARVYYEDAEVTVQVARFASKKIFVFGEVAGAGPYTYYGANTVLRTLAEAEPTRIADTSRIQVLRPNADGSLVRKMTVDMNKMVKSGDTTLNAVLEEGDIIYVPPTPFASVGLAFQQILLPFQPMAATIRGPNDIDNSARVYESSE